MGSRDSEPTIPHDHIYLFSKRFIRTYFLFLCPSVLLVSSVFFFQSSPFVFVMSWKTFTVHSFSCHIFFKKKRFNDMFMPSSRRNSHHSSTTPVLLIIIYYISTAKIQLCVVHRSIVERAWWEAGGVRGSLRSVGEAVSQGRHRDRGEGECRSPQELGMPRCTQDG